MAGYTVVHQALRTQAQRWDELSAEMTVIAQKVANLGLGPTAFWLGLSYVDIRAELYAATYKQFQIYMLALFQDGAKEFKELGDALVRAADGYVKVDKINPDEIFGPPA